MQNITAIIQARLGSTRLQGKTMMDLEGEPLLGHLIKRIKKSKYITDIVIATTTHERDGLIVNYAEENKLRSYRGSEQDVLDRFYQAALLFKAQVIVRVTPDCPLLDSRVSDRVIERFLGGDYDYVSNTIVPTYPDGLDTEVFSFEVLERAWNEASLPSEREHVTAYIVKHPELFKHFNVRNEGEDLSWMRWTVDTARDYEFVSGIMKKLGKPDDIFHMEDVLRVLKANPELLEINKGINRNEGYAVSLMKDKSNDN
jgi:spore coat polysaccharide biosynthesis protein SpsF (cytidylyltransferase family)